MKIVTKYLICVWVCSIGIGCSEMTGLEPEQGLIETQFPVRFSSTYEPTTITVGTYNIRSSVHDIEGHTWNDRRTYVSDIILQQNNYPDILGIQEGQVLSQIEDLESLLESEYDSFVSSQAMSPRAIFWKKDKFTLLATNTVDLLGSHAPGSYGTTRYASYVRLRHNDSNKMLMVFNVHLTWGTTSAIREARYLAAASLARKAKRYSDEYFDHAPAIVLGDLNHYPEPEAGGFPTAAATLISHGLKDTYDYTTNHTNKDYYTINNMETAKTWLGPDGSKRLDYIFTYPGSVTVNSWSNIINFANEPTLDLDTPVPSDHHPVRSSINLPDRVTDVDGYGYNVISIGGQDWIAENLKTTKYRNGATIISGLNSNNWISTTEGAFTLYPHSAVDGIDSGLEMLAAYGRLYNWYAVNDERGLCPEGWKVPTDADWKQLEEYLGMTQQDADATGWRSSGNVGRKIKDTGAKNSRGWKDNGGGTNESGFSAVPGGFRSGSSGSYDRIEEFGYWWTAPGYTSSNSYRRILRNIYNGVHRTNTQKQEGASVRCIAE